MPQRSTSFRALLLCLCTALAGCSTIFYTGTPTVTPASTGNWLIAGLYPDSSGYRPYSFGGSMVINGQQVSGIFHVNQPCFAAGKTDIPYTGTLDSNRQLSLTSSTVAGETITLQGTLSSDGSSLSNVHFVVAGNCTGTLISSYGPDGPGASLNPTAVQLPSFTNTWTAAPGGIGPSITEQLTQSSTPDTHGDFPLTGTVQIQGSSCFTTGTLQPGSFVSGTGGAQIIALNDGSTLTGSTTIQLNVNSSKPSMSLSPATVTGGKCDGAIGLLLM